MPSANLGPDYDFPKRLSALESLVGQLSSRDVLQNASIGAGGITVYGGSITVTGTGSISLASGTLSALSVVGTSSVSTATLAVSGNATVNGQIFIPNGFAAVSGYTVAYINVDGRISVGASALRFKQDFEPVDEEAYVAALDRVNAVHFRLIAAVEEIDFKIGPLAEGEERGRAPVEIGFIADQLDEIGLGEFVYRNSEGEPLGIHYERLVIPLLMGYRSLDRRLRAGGL